MKNKLILWAIAFMAMSAVRAQDTKTVDLSKIDPSKLDPEQIKKMDPEKVKKVLGENPVLFLKIMDKGKKWEEPAEPAHIVGPIYFVGTKGLCSWLIKTSGGFILMNTCMPGSGPMIEASIKKLGFKPEDVKLLLVGHAHTDHAGGHAYIKRVTGAEVAILDAEQPLLESGGKTDFFYGAYPEFLYEPVKADRVFKDGEKITLGDVTLTALDTPGHSKGSTTYTMDVVDGGKTYKVVFPDGSGVNPGYRVAVNPSYPGIADDYRRTFKILGHLKPDISLGSHTEMVGYDARLARSATEGVKAWVDPDGYAKSVADARAAFEAQVKAEEAAAAKK